MKNYDHLKIEKKWQKEWEKKKVYKTFDNSKKKKFYILDMFPYPSGEGLHVGHPKGYIATDIVSRMKRMQGFNVLHPMGWDAFGLPAENYAIKTKTNPMVSVAKNIARYKKQLEIIGLDYDWSREVNTTDPKFYKWTQWIFLKLLEKGLAYESNEPVNWCPFDKTILSNEDVEDGKCERCGTLVEKKPIRQWVLKITDYAERLLADLDALDWPESIKESQRNWIGKSIGAEIKFSVDKHDITVFTTRPETIFGVTFLAVSPEMAKSWIEIGWPADEKIKKYIDDTLKERLTGGFEEKQKTGIYAGFDAINPANKEKVPVWIVNYVLGDVGTGAIMGVPAHDERDYAFAKKFNLEIKQVIAPFFEAGEGHPDKVQKNKPLITRDVIYAIIKHWSENKYLVLKWKQVDHWTSFVMGGIDKGESNIDAAKREVEEETGYIDIKNIEDLNFEVHSKFYQQQKQENRYAKSKTIFIELGSGKQEKVNEEENNKHEMLWLDENKVKDFLVHGNHKISWQKYLEKNSIFSENGILINSGKFDGANSEDAKKEIIKFVGGKEKTTYKLHDWIFSRQRYWGEPIPVLRDGSEIIPLKEKDLPVKLPKVKSYEPTGSAESPLAGIPKWINVKVGKKVLKRENNTMPQWAGSSWYYLRYMDPKNNKFLVDKKKEKYWNMVDLYVGGAEHATRHLIYARFWHKFLFDIGVVADKEPFKRLQHVGLIIASDGRKMSKRFGNIVNPDSVISTFGADTLRIYEMFMGPFDQSVSWSTDSMVGPRRFLERVWKVSSRLEKVSSPSVVKLLHKTIKKVDEDINSMHFNTAVSSLMIFANEMEKNSINEKDYKKFLQILSPFAPHITEELWSVLREKKSINFSAWPKWKAKLIKDDEIKIVVQINGKMKIEMMISADNSEEDVKKKVMQEETILKNTEGKDIKRIIYVKNRLINIVV